MCSVPFRTSGPLYGPGWMTPTYSPRPRLMPYPSQHTPPKRAHWANSIFSASVTFDSLMRCPELDTPSQISKLCRCLQAMHEGCGAQQSPATRIGDCLLG